MCVTMTAGLTSTAVFRATIIFTSIACLCPLLLNTNSTFHPLVLRDRVVDEHYDYEEQYCDVCETLRDPELGVYYCEECNYAADIDCVIPKVSPTSQNFTTFSFSEASSS
ncbi:hypothetical protein CDL15_Pgr027147 [Punica granatum]|uniref:DC1 domain-containing protein n=1 Tax=Punica granatum TaxID=22663 RepID=A0A218XB68_PUNGR|nr:hypothetical protein CDL15_Pgr027147 [Punica granatum]